MKLDPDIHHSTRVVHAKESICCYVRAKVKFKACKNRQEEGRIESINCAAVMWTYSSKVPKRAKTAILHSLSNYGLPYLF